VIFLRALADPILPLVDNAVDGDVCLVHLGERQPLTIGRPPEAVTASHLFLRDVLGETVGATCAARAFGDLQRCTAIDGDNVELRVLHVGDSVSLG
jgi:hypothetical protein